MNIRFPYWWFSKPRNPKEKFEFSDYVMRQHALPDAKHDGGSNVVSPYPSGSPTGEKVLAYIYQLLGVLDTKASALMRLNGVMLAAAAFLVNPQYGSCQIVKYLVAGSGIGSTISIAFCLLVVSVDWPFLGLVTKKSGQDGSSQLDFSEEFFHLQQVADFRQLFYRLGWTVSLATTIAFLIAIVIFFAGLFAGR